MSVFLMVAIVIPAGAQTIQKGNKFFNGKVLYTVLEVRSGTTVYMTGEGNDGEYHEMTLEKTPGKAGEYTLQPSARADDSPVPGAFFGSTVRYVRQQGMNFLAVEGNFGGLVEILVLTPDNLKNCLGQQDFAKDQPISELAGNLLFNSDLLAPFPNDELKDLSARKLDKKNPTVIERYNQQLVKGTVAYREAMEAFNNPDGLGGDGRGEDEIAEEETIKERIYQIFNDLARRNAGGEGNPTPQEFEARYTSASWLATVGEVMKKDEGSEGIGFYDHDYWTFSQDPSPDIKVKKILVEEMDDGMATVLVRFVNWPGSKPQTMWMELVLEVGEYKVNNIRNYDDAFDSGFFDYMVEMKKWLEGNE